MQEDLLALHTMSDTSRVSLHVPALSGASSARPAGHLLADIPPASLFPPDPGLQEEGAPFCLPLSAWLLVTCLVRTLFLGFLILPLKGPVSHPQTRYLLPVPTQYSIFPCHGPCHTTALAYVLMSF